MKKELSISKLANKLDNKYAGKKPAYYGVFLDEVNHNLLLSWWESKIDKPLLAKIFAHHTTIKFKPTDEDVINYQSLIGQKFDLKVTGYNADEKGQAVVVELKGISSTNAIPHITISCSEETMPSYSNDLLKSNIISIDGPLLSGIFDQFPRTK